MQIDYVGLNYRGESVKGCWRAVVFLKSSQRRKIRDRLVIGLCGPLSRREVHLRSSRWRCQIRAAGITEERLTLSVSSRPEEVIGVIR